MKPIDIHTHHERGGRHLYSAGLHPWETADATEEQLGRLDAVIERDYVVAIGEVGLDALRGAPLERQEEMLRHFIKLSERVEKPLIIHCVRAWDRLLKLHREMKPKQPWAIHGFRGKPELARQLLDEGMYISLGRRYNPATAAIIPGERLLIESDDEADANLEALAAELPAYDRSSSLKFLGLCDGETVEAVVNLSDSQKK